LGHRSEVAPGLSSQKKEKDMLPDPNENLFKYVVPTDIWYENGYDWSLTITWENKLIVSLLANGKFIKRRFYSQNFATLSKMKAKTMEFKTCMCERCLEGRKLVEKGWEPEYDKLTGKSTN
jgi:hypothetical protein